MGFLPPFNRCKHQLFTMEENDVGELERLRVRHDNSGAKPGWFLNEIIVSRDDMNEEWVFPCNRWLAVNVDDREIERTLYPVTPPNEDDEDL